MNNDFILIDAKQKTNISDLSLVVTTVTDSLGVYISTSFLVTPSENASSIEIRLDLLRIDSNPSHDLSGITSCSIMTDELSALVKVVPFMTGYYHYMCSFHINQLTVRVSFFKYNLL